MLLEEDDCIKLAFKIGEILIKSSLRLSVAESCTGGWLAKCCTDCVGSSSWFEHGIVSYSYESKSTLLSVPKSLINSYGAVNKQTVESMVKRLLKNSNSQVGVAISGIAGPSSDETQKPVGLVCFAWSIKNGYQFTEEVHFKGERNQVRMQSVYYALKGIIQLLEYKKKQYG